MQLSTAHAPQHASDFANVSIKKRRRWKPALIGAALLSVLLSACGGLAGEPRIVSTAALPTVTPTPPPDIGHPTARVSLARGAEIFGGAQGCQACHGISGKGDGPIASNFACPMPNFTDPQMARSQTISSWFAITTGGNQGTTDCLMPPWNQRLNEQQRWDVTSYAYSLHYTADLLAKGQALWQDNCAACHGQTGKGDGPKAKESARPVPNFTDPSYMLALSDTDLWKTATNGLGNAMPSFKDKLSDDERWAVTAYARSLTWELAIPATPAATQAVTASTPESPTLIVKGKLANGTPGAQPIAAGQALTLRLVDLSNASSPRDVQTLQTNSAADGSFSFGDVQRQLGMVYVVTTVYGGQLQTSTPLRLAAGSGASIDVSFMVFEVTSNPSVIQVETERIFFAPFSANTMLVQQGIGFLNTSQRLFSSGPTSVEARLPVGAQRVTIDPSLAQQFSVDKDGLIHALGPVLPGENFTVGLQVSYLLPYDSNFTFSMTLPYLITALDIHTPQTSSLIPADAPFIPGDALTLQEGVYNTFTLQGQVPAGTPVQFSLKGPQDVAADQRRVLALVLFIGISALAVTAGAVVWLNRQREPAAPRDVGPSGAVIAAIADLDNRYENGQIGREEYETERVRLKAEATRLLK